MTLKTPANSSPGPDGDAAYAEQPRRGRGALWIAGLGIALLTAAAFALSYDALYATALAGGVRPTLAFLYPAVFDGFLVVAFAGALVLRSARLRVTWYPWTLIVLLLSAAGAANVLHAVGRAPLLPPDLVNVIVASVPLASLGLAFPLWLVMFVHVRDERRARHAVGTAPGRDTAAEPPASNGRRATATEPERPGEGKRTERSAVAALPSATPPSGQVRSSPTPPDD